jgi:hypothetical protein
MMAAVETAARDPHRPSALRTGFIHMCCVCRSVRRADATWEPAPIVSTNHAKVSHGLCPTCYSREYEAA